MHHNVAGMMVVVWLTGEEVKPLHCLCPVGDRRADRRRGVNTEGHFKEVTFSQPRLKPLKRVTSNFIYTERISPRGEIQLPGPLIEAFLYFTVFIESHLFIISSFLFRHVVSLSSA